MSSMTNQSDLNPVVIFSMEKPLENLTLVESIMERVILLPGVYLGSGSCSSAFRGMCGCEGCVSTWILGMSSGSFVLNEGEMV